MRCSTWWCLRWRRSSCGPRKTACPSRCGGVVALPWRLCSQEGAALLCAVHGRPAQPTRGLAHARCVPACTRAHAGARGPCPRTGGPWLERCACTGVRAQACENATATLAGIATTEPGQMACLAHRVPRAVVSLIRRCIGGGWRRAERARHHATGCACLRACVRACAFCVDAALRALPLLRRRLQVRGQRDGLLRGVRLVPGPAGAPPHGQDSSARGGGHSG